MATFTLQRSQSLKKENDIKMLTTKGESFFYSPIRFIWLLKSNNTSPSTLQLVFTTPKSAHPKAHDRNRIKRLMREAWRLHQTNLILPQGCNCYCMLIYKLKTLPTYNEVETSVKDFIAFLNQRYGS